MTKLYYFDQDQADADDMMLGTAKAQGYVPQTCLLGGATVFRELGLGLNPCRGCNGPREKCHGQAKREKVYP
jgi:hypothetical protein